ncbi:MAG: hypothetical protein AWM53_01907 [Candidatus Dichloromethanomonas elyunquensis]|nr:MAG: hypothetical protein AWM53_01907 [Candidatus Dichloromethanomonas elyunquensis]
MAVVSNTLDATVAARYQTGISANGSPILRQKTFAGIKANASDQDVYDVVAALFSLLQYPLIDVRRDQHFDLVNQ